MDSIIPPDRFESEAASLPLAFVDDGVAEIPATVA
jgi:hypothetical protein